MPDLAYYKGRWIAQGEDGSIAAVGESLNEARQFGVQARPRSRLTLAWVSPYPPHVMLPEWPLTTVQGVPFKATTWLAGGPVRDLLLGRVPHDWDFVTEGSGLQLARAVANTLGGAYYALDAERGTGRAIVDRPGSTEPIMLDFAELRGPSIEADLWERDFTVNAMALTLDGQLIDPTGGRFDLEAELLRMTKCSTFEDDPVRLLRAVRLATQFTFTIEAETATRLRSQTGMIRHIAPERIRQELVKLLAHPRAHIGLEQLAWSGLLSGVLPELADASAAQETAAKDNALAGAVALVSTLHELDQLLHGGPRTHTPRGSANRHGTPPAWGWQMLSQALAQQQRELLVYLNTRVSAEVTRSDLLKWSALFCGPTAAEEASWQRAAARLEGLRFSGSSIGFTTVTLRALPQFAELVARGSGLARAPISDLEIYRYYRSAGESGVAVALLALARLLAASGSKLNREEWMQYLMTAAALLEAYFDRRDTVISPARLLTGHDLIQMGLPQGPELGQALERLREAQAAGEVKNRPEAVAFVEQDIRSLTGSEITDVTSYETS